MSYSEFKITPKQSEAICPKLGQEGWLYHASNHADGIHIALKVIHSACQAKLVNAFIHRRVQR